MGYSVASINSEDTGVKAKQAQQEQIMQMQQLKDSKVQEDGTKIEDSSAVTSVAGKTDTIEISTEGQKALEQIRAAKASFKPAPSVPQKSTEEADDETSAVAEETSSNASIVEELTQEDDSDSVSTSDLYSMSEDELRSLVSNGSITKKQMENELKRREKPSENEE